MVPITPPIITGINNRMQRIHTTRMQRTESMKKRFDQLPLTAALQ
jgi:hypothetical protein